MDFQQVVNVTFEISNLLDRLNIEHFVGGSLPSIVHGEPRSTNDVDIVADMTLKDIAPFQRELGDAYYHDTDMIRDAIERNSSFNIMRFKPFIKFAIFLLRKTPDALEEMRRRKRYLLIEDPPRKLPLSSPEDTLLQKLRWYSLGMESLINSGETSWESSKSRIPNSTETT